MAIGVRSETRRFVTGASQGPSGSDRGLSQVWWRIIVAVFGEQVQARNTRAPRGFQRSLCLTEDRVSVCVEMLVGTLGFEPRTNGL